MVVGGEIGSGDVNTIGLTSSDVGENTVIWFFMPTWTGGSCTLAVMDKKRELEENGEEVNE